MPLSPPWKWFMQEWPNDGDTVWIVRIGDPEKPFLATWNAGSATFVTLDPPGVQTLLGLVVLKWRPQ